MSELSSKTNEVIKYTYDKRIKLIPNENYQKQKIKLETNRL